MANAPYPLLSTLQCLPLLGALLLFLWRGQADKQHGRASTLAIWLGRFIALLELFLVLDLYRRLDASNPQLQFAEHLPSLGYHVAADGLTVLFMLLTALTTVLLSFYGMAREHLSPARLISILLLIEATLMSLLSTLNLLWFAAAASLQLILISYLLWRWASAEAERQALSRFLQYQLLGCALFMAGVVVLGWNHADKHAGAWHFDLFELMQTPPSSTLQSLAFFLLFYGLAIRTPLFPLHGWLPNTARHGLVAVGPILLLGVKIGIYGMARFVLPLTPWAVVHWQPYVIAFATAGIFYAATLALLQTNLRRLMAFCVVSHTSLIIIGLFTLHPSGIQGALLLSVNFGLAITVMLLMVGYVYRRTHSTDLADLMSVGGLFDRIPFIAIVFLLGGLSIVGMPGTPSFEAVHLVLEAAIERFGALPTVAAALGNVITAGFLLWAFQRAFLAPLPKIRPGATPTPFEPTHAMEYFIGGLSLLALLLIGFFPAPWLTLTDSATQVLAARLRPF